MNDIARAPTAVAPGTSLVMRGLRVLKREPILFVTLGYIALSFIGLWASYWFYAGFGLPILEYLQASDFLVAGLRDPIYFVVLAGAAGFAWLVNWPERWRIRNPEKSELLRGRWWGRVAMPRRSFFGMSAETGLAFAIFWCAIWLLFWFVIDKSESVRAGGGHVVGITLAGQPAPLPGSPRLLGTSSAFVFLYWPEGERAEALPIESIARIESLRRPTPSAPKPAAATDRIPHAR
jgi:hypothetical protein